MRDTLGAVAELVTERHRAMTPAERCVVASAMFETARVVVEASLPGHLAGQERRIAVARRFYGEELPEAALTAHSQYVARCCPEI
jgi:hypothetical protein